MAGASHAEAERVARADRAVVLAVVARESRDVQVAEDAVQEALLAALERWPRRGIPARPAAWLTTVARRAAWKALRARRRHAGDEGAIAALASAAAVEPDDAPAIPDERLELLFACCHPALALDAQVALMLRAVAGLTTAEIARAFLLEEATLAQRLVRAQRKIRESGIPFAVPPPERLAERLAGVLGVVYLVFTEGHAATSGPGRVRADLCAEAVRLARLVAALLPGEPEALGLAALVLAHDARRAARVGPDGRSVALDEQDRSRYDAAKVAEAGLLLARAMTLHRPGPYQLQGAIAHLHASAPSAEATDWRQIALLYGALRRRSSSPMVALNHAGAVGMAEGPAAGLALLEHVTGLDDHVLLHATRAELLRRAGREAEALAAYDRALALVPAGGAQHRDLVERATRSRARGGLAGASPAPAP